MLLCCLTLRDLWMFRGTIYIVTQKSCLYIIVELISCSQQCISLKPAKRDTRYNSGPILTMKYHILQDARNYLFIMLQLNGTLFHLRKDFLL